jgi:hypothetical protein
MIRKRHSKNLIYIKFACQVSNINRALDHNLLQFLRLRSQAGAEAACLTPNGAQLVDVRFVPKADKSFLHIATSWPVSES